MSAILKQAQKVQEEMQKAQDNLENITVEGSAGGGMVKVVANCKYRIQSVRIDPEVIKVDDKEMLEDLVAAAVNQVITAAQQKANEEMEKITGGLLGGMNLPGGMKFPGL
jgi:DNA-binding YbaB/EbfC family protein